MVRAFVIAIMVGTFCGLLPFLAQGLLEVDIVSAFYILINMFQKSYRLIIIFIFRIN